MGGFSSLKPCHNKSDNALAFIGLILLQKENSWKIYYSFSSNIVLRNEKLTGILPSVTVKEKPLIPDMKKCLNIAFLRGFVYIKKNTFEEIKCNFSKKTLGNDDLKIFDENRDILMDVLNKKNELLESKTYEKLLREKL